MKELNCGSVVPGCDWVGRAATEAELLRKAAEHARTVHGVEEITPDMLARIKGAVHDKADAPTSH